jgi:hypothetical protein
MHANISKRLRLAFVLVCGVLSLAVSLFFILNYTAGKNADARVIFWWALLCGCSVANLSAWVLSKKLLESKASGDQKLNLLRRRQVILSGVFVAACSLRSFFPKADVQRYVLFGSWVSSILVGRALATVAELCFVIQLALLIRELAQETANRLGLFIARLVVPLIVIAEICSWYSTLTTSYLGNIFEESLWAFSGLLLTVAAISLWKRSSAQWKKWLMGLICFGFCYVAFMSLHDVPMYVMRYQANAAQQNAHLSFSQGIKDVSEHWIVTYRWQDWKDEIPWLTLYFSLAVWISIGLAHAPLLEAEQSDEMRHDRVAYGNNEKIIL